MAPSSSFTNNSNDTPQSLWLYRTDYETWERFHPDDCLKLNQAVSSGHRGVIVERSDREYYVDLVHLRQTNVETGQLRRVQCIEPHSEWFLLKKQPATTFNSKNPYWIPFPRDDADQIEAALFAGLDFVILYHGDEETYYIDLARWTFTDLCTNTSYSIKAEASNDHHVQPKTSASTSCSIPPTVGVAKRPPSKSAEATADTMESVTSSLASTTTTVSSSSCGSSTTKQVVVEEESEHTQSMEDSERSLPPLMIPTPNLKNDHDDYPNSAGMWLWRDDYGLWSCYDDDLAHAMEDSWVKGETGVLVNRGSVSYYVDFLDMTQTNIETGLSRLVQRGHGRHGDGDDE